MSKKAVSSLFGQRLKSQRKKRKLTQQNVADTIDVDVKTYRKWEKSETPARIPFDKLSILCGKDCLDCDPDYLLDRLKESSHANKIIKETIGISENAIEKLKESLGARYLIDLLLTTQAGNQLLLKIRNYIDSYPGKDKNGNLYNIVTIGNQSITLSEDSFYLNEAQITSSLARTSILLEIRDLLEKLYENEKENTDEFNELFNE